MAAAKYDQLHMMTNNPTKFEQNQLSSSQGVVSTMSSVKDAHTDGQQYFFVPFSIVVGDKSDKMSTASYNPRDRNPEMLDKYGHNIQT